MFTSDKVFWIAAALYSLVVLAPGMVGESDLVPQTYVHSAMAACGCFMVGLWLGKTLFPFALRRPPQAVFHPAQAHWTATVAVLVVLAVGVMIFGPTPPMVEAFTNPDSFAVALLREDAVKLNQSEVFVRLYSWGRDIVGPVVFVWALHAWRLGRGFSGRLTPVVGLLAAAFLALWSGQKATIVNYLLAAFIFASPTPAAMVVRLIQAVPVVLLLIVLTFAVTQPDLFLDGFDPFVVFEVFGMSIVNRVLWVPLEVAAVYAYSADELRIIGSLDAVPYLSFLWTPGILSLENQVALEFYHQGIDSGHSNALAFAYAYVLGGYAACLAGGVLTMAVMKFSVRIVASLRSSYVDVAFSAFACYLLVDMLNGNFIQYLLKLVAFACLLWAGAQLLRGQKKSRTSPQPRHV